MNFLNVGLNLCANWQRAPMDDPGSFPSEQPSGKIDDLFVEMERLIVSLFEEMERSFFFKK